MQKKIYIFFFHNLFKGVDRGLDQYPTKTTGKVGKELLRTWPRGYKTFYMLNSTLSMEFQLLIKKTTTKYRLFLLINFQMLYLAC